MSPEQLTRVDVLMRELLELLDNCVIVDFDEKHKIFIVAAYCDEKSCDPDDGWPCPRIEYQVSDGLPGSRSDSDDALTYAEARTLFANRVEEAKKKAQKR